MPILLEAPTYKPGGPDGQGWNRLSLNAHMGGSRNQCALRPRSYAALYESRDTRRARWGGFGRCTQDDGRCTTCPRLSSKSLTMSAFTDRVLVRILVRAPGGIASSPVVELHLMNKPEDGWSSMSYRWTWDEIARLAGWRLDGQHRDEHSEGFWLRKVNPARPDGLPDCTHGYLNRDHCRTCRAEIQP